MESTKHYSLTETAKLIREALKAAFPKTKFSVRSKSYSGGSSITAHWTDGPTSAQVKPILEVFEGASFDGMIDLKSYNAPSEWNGQRVTFGVDFVFGSRDNSVAALREAADWVSYNAGLPLVNIVEDGKYSYIKQDEAANRTVPFQFFVKENGEPCLSHDSHRGEYYSHLVNQCMHAKSYEATATKPSTPTYVTEEYINSKVEAMLAEVN